MRILNLMSPTQVSPLELHVWPARYMGVSRAVEESEALRGHWWRYVVARWNTFTHIT